MLGGHGAGAPVWRGGAGALERGQIAAGLHVEDSELEMNIFRLEHGGDHRGVLAFSSWTEIPEAENLKEGSTASKPVFAVDSLMAVQPVALRPFVAEQHGGTMV